MNDTAELNAITEKMARDFKRANKRPQMPIVNPVEKIGPAMVVVPPTWLSVGSEIDSLLRRFSVLDDQLEKLRHGKLAKEVRLEDGQVIPLERMPREELILAKLAEVADARDALAKAQEQLSEKVAALGAVDIGPVFPARNFASLPPKPGPIESSLAPVDDRVLDQLEADLAEVLNRPQAPARRWPKPAPPEPKSRMRRWFAR